MCHSSVLKFGEELTKKYDFKGKTILEIGSYDVNGTLQQYFRPLAKEYIGVDIEHGPGVDEVVDEDADLVKTYGKNSFDIVICTEMLEHAKDWRKAITAIKQIAREAVIVTTRSPGFPYHAFPNDYWRYTHADFAHIFGDLDIKELQDDDELNHPGIFLYALKPKGFKEKSLKSYEVTPAPQKP